MIRGSPIDSALVAWLSWKKTVWMSDFESCYKSFNNSLKDMREKEELVLLVKRFRRSDEGKVQYKCKCFYICVYLRHLTGRLNVGMIAMLV